MPHIVPRPEKAKSFVAGRGMAQLKHKFLIARATAKISMSGFYALREELSFRD